VPDGREVVVGTIVRVPLQGRSVRGWVVETDVDSDTDPARLRPLKKIVGAGPPAEVLALADWAAWRWAGPVVAFLRVASPENSVSPPEVTPVRSDVVTPVATSVVRVHRWAPASPRGALVSSLLADHGSTIVVLPDARRTGALVRSLGSAGRSVVVLRSDRSAAERTRAWRAASEGGCVVVGGRTAVWAPVPDLAAIVVLDEGDEALKEERAPAWHARDVAIERARRLGSRVELVTPVPTIDAIVAADEVLRPSRPDERAGWPMVEVVDRREEPPGFGLLTASLGAAIHRAIDATGALGGGRAVCVLNRKGRARLLACVVCGELARCEVCGAAVIETDAGLLSCPRCSTTRPKVCLHCHATRMKAVRPGVARLREDLSALLPRASVVEVEAATAEIPPADVLVGTEAVLHRVPIDAARPVRLVVFLDADQELLAPRVHAAEQALFLMARAARLVGPRSGPGRILIQTRVPDHEVVEAVRRAEPDLVTGPERARREALGYPPFGGLAELSGAAAAVDVVAVALRAIDGITVLGPVEVGAGKRALAQAADVDALCDALAEATPGARSFGRLRVEMDPLRV
jgi:primosomal protein N' (replication factor Y) (superfamily II helicase)